MANKPRSTFTQSGRNPPTANNTRAVENPSVKQYQEALEKRNSPTDVKRGTSTSSISAATANSHSSNTSINTRSMMNAFTSLSKSPLSSNTKNDPSPQSGGNAGRGTSTSSRSANSHSSNTSINNRNMMNAFVAASKSPLSSNTKNDPSPQSGGDASRESEQSNVKDPQKNKDSQDAESDQADLSDHLSENEKTSTHNSQESMNLDGEQYGWYRKAERLFIDSILSPFIPNGHIRSIVSDLIPSSAPVLAGVATNFYCVLFFIGAYVAYRVIKKLWGSKKDESQIASSDHDTRSEEIVSPSIDATKSVVTTEQDGVLPGALATLVSFEYHSQDIKEEVERAARSTSDLDDAENYMRLLNGIDGAMRRLHESDEINKKNKKSFTIDGEGMNAEQVIQQVVTSVIKVMNHPSSNPKTRNKYKKVYIDRTIAFFYALMRLKEMSDRSTELDKLLMDKVYAANDFSHLEEALLKANSSNIEGVYDQVIKYMSNIWANDKYATGRSPSNNKNQESVSDQETASLNTDSVSGKEIEDDQLSVVDSDITEALSQESRDGSTRKAKEQVSVLGTMLENIYSFYQDAAKKKELIYFSDMLSLVKESDKVYYVDPIDFKDSERYMRSVDGFGELFDREVVEDISLANLSNSSIYRASCLKIHSNVCQTRMWKRLVIENFSRDSYLSLKRYCIDTKGVYPETEAQSHSLSLYTCLSLANSCIRRLFCDALIDSRVTYREDQDDLLVSLRLSLGVMAIVLDRLNAATSIVRSSNQLSSEKREKMRALNNFIKDGIVSSLGSVAASLNLLYAQLCSSYKTTQTKNSNRAASIKSTVCYISSQMKPNIITDIALSLFGKESNIIERIVSHAHSEIMVSVDYYQTGKTPDTLPALIYSSREATRSIASMLYAYALCPSLTESIRELFSSWASDKKNQLVRDCYNWHNGNKFKVNPMSPLLTCVIDDAHTVDGYLKSMAQFLLNRSSAKNGKERENALDRLSGAITQSIDSDLKNWMTGYWTLVAGLEGNGKMDIRDEKSALHWLMRICYNIQKEPIQKILADSTRAIRESHIGSSHSHISETSKEKSDGLVRREIEESEKELIFITVALSMMTEKNSLDE